MSDSVNYATPGESARPTMARHGVMGFLCVLAFITYFDRVCIARARPEIQRDLGLTDVQMGWVLSIFFLAYALFEIPGGWFSDRFGARRGLTRIVLWWSLFTALSGSAVGFYSLLLCRFLFGVGEAGAFPSMARVQSSWLPLRSRGMASGLLWLSARWGAAFSPLVFGLMLTGLGSSAFDRAVTSVPGLGWLADVAAWRLSFWASGLIGVVWVVVFYAWFRDEPAESRSVNRAELALIREGQPAGGGSNAAGHHVDRKTWLALVSSRSIWAISILYFFVGFGFSFFITWMPKYFESVHKMAPKDTEGLSTLPLLCAGFACIAGGMTSDWIVRRTGRRRATRMTIAVSGYLIAAVSMFLIRGAESPRAAVALMCVAVFAFDFGQGSNWASIVDIGGRFAGIAAGFLNMVGNTAGFVQPVVAPYVFKNYGWDVLFALYALAFVLAAVMWAFIDPTKRFYEGRDPGTPGGFPIVIEPEPLVKT